MARVRRRICTKDKKISVIVSRKGHYIPFFPAPLIKAGKNSIEWPLVFEEPISELMGSLMHSLIWSNSSFFYLINNKKFQNKVLRVMELLDRYQIPYTVKKTSSDTRELRIYNREFMQTLYKTFDCYASDFIEGLSYIPFIVLDSPLSVKKSFVKGYLNFTYKEIVDYNNELYFKIVIYHPDLIPAFKSLMREVGLDCLSGKFCILSKLNMTIDYVY